MRPYIIGVWLKELCTNSYKLYINANSNLCKNGEGNEDWNGCTLYNGELFNDVNMVI